VLPLLNLSCQRAIGAWFKEEFMKVPRIGGVVLLVLVLAAPAAWAQGGGASSTGTIQGRVVDAQGAVLPGVSVTATSPALLGAQTSVTSENGNYRFPAVPPGTYTLTYELTGFNSVKREGVQIALGFTANINVELALATLQETVTVTGASPVIDTTATRVVQNFKLDQLQSIPNGRDMWALLAVTPSVQMSRIDVGGNRAGTQTGYTAYCFTGQVRVLIEGINTTEGTGGAGFYFDYSSLEEVFLGTSGQSAEMPNPGVQSQFIAKSGGNQFNGEYYLDWYTTRCRAPTFRTTTPHRPPSTTARFVPEATRSRVTTTPPSIWADPSSGTKCGGLEPTASSRTRCRCRTSPLIRRTSPNCGIRSSKLLTRPTRTTR
jgi:hypothetical protein